MTMVEQAKWHEIDTGIAMSGAKKTGRTTESSKISKRRDNQCNANEYAPMTNRSTNDQL